MTEKSFSRYKKQNTLLHNTDPITKLFLYLLLIITIFVAQNFYPLLIVCIVILLISFVSKVKISTNIKIFVFVIPFFLIMFGLYSLFQVIFEGAASYDPIEELAITGKMALRFYSFILMSVIYTYTTKEMEIANSINFVITPLKYIRVPTYEISMMIMLAIRFIPLVLSDMHKIMIAQTSRGHNVINGNWITRIKGLKNSLLPMFVISFRRADDTSTAMSVRGYKIGQKRSKYVKNKFGVLEIFTLLISVSLLSFIIYLQVINWGELSILT